jgi:hypothetical protein
MGLFGFPAQANIVSLKNFMHACMALDISNLTFSHWGVQAALDISNIWPLKVKRAVHWCLVGILGCMYTMLCK